jgi:hypothetical protein
MALRHTSVSRFSPKAPALTFTTFEVLDDRRS